MQEDKQALIDALAMLVRAEIVDFNGHASLRCGDGARMLINAGGAPRHALTPADIVNIDFDGGRIEGEAAPPMEFHIHAAIYRRRPDVRAVIHAHPLWSTVLSSAGQAVRPVTMQAAVLGEIKSFPKIASINTAALGAELAATLGAARVAVLQSHGTVAAGASLLEAFALTIYLEETARRHYLAAQLGPVRELSAEERATIGANLWQPHLLQKLWDYHEAPR